MAADPAGAVALAVLGVDSLSVPVNRLTSVRRLLSCLDPVRLAAARHDLLRQETTAGVREVLYQAHPDLRGTDYVL
jgi:phosphoenolpyruvate-protein kinase (PTS system EI component)